MVDSADARRASARILVKRQRVCINNQPLNDTEAFERCINGMLIGEEKVKLASWAYGVAVQLKRAIIMLWLNV